MTDNIIRGGVQVVTPNPPPAPKVGGKWGTAVPRTQPSWTEHQYTKEIVCPYCGYEHLDSWEMDGEDGEEMEMECHHCEKTFTYERMITIEFKTYTKEEDCEHEGRIFCDKCGKKLEEEKK